MYGRYGNPYMRRWTRVSENGGMAIEQQPATYKGVTGKSILLVLLTIVIALVTEIALWATIYNVSIGNIETDTLVRLVVIGAAISGVAGLVMMIGSIVLIFNVNAARFVGILYSVMQGVFLGTIASFLNIFLPGVTLAALLGTGIVFVMCLFLYKVLSVRISGKFARGLVIAAISFLLVELICVPVVWIISAQSGNVALIIGVQAAIAFFCVTFATITIFWDIQNIDYMVKAGADKKYEWILAFSLTTSLIYLYIEILELILRAVSLIALSKNK